MAYLQIQHQKKMVNVFAKFLLIVTLRKARKSAEKQLNRRISRKESKEILRYCERKLQYIEKDENYLPLLYESELVLQVCAREMNVFSSKLSKIKKEVDNYVCRMSSDTVSSMLS